MKTLETIYNKLNSVEKTELETHKVELAKITELEEYEYELNAGIDILMKFATDAREAIAKGVRELNRLNSVKKVAERIYGDVEQQAKELGIDIPELKKLKKAISAFEQQKKSLTKVLK